MKFLTLSITILTLSSASLIAASGITEIVTDKAPKAIGPYSQATVAGSYMFISGQIGIDPTTGKLAGDTIEMQTKQILKNLSIILEAKGLTLENVVKTNVYLKDLKDFGAMNTIYEENFSYSVKPARATIQAAALPLGALIEIQCEAFIPNS